VYAARYIAHSNDCLKIWRMSVSRELKLDALS